MLLLRLPSFYSSPAKELYNQKAFITHAALLRQTFVHCAKFPTAASRRSLGRISVPVWLIILSDQLSVIGLVSHYLTNYLMERGPILPWPKPFPLGPVSPRAYAVLATVSSGCPPRKGRLPTRYSPVRHSPPGSKLPVLPFDLHVLSMPPAFVLSQDQTLQLILFRFPQSPEDDRRLLSFYMLVALPLKARPSPEGLD